MVKLSIGKSLEQVGARCSFCGEGKKDCVRGSIVFEVEIPKSELKYTIPSWRYETKGIISFESFMVVEGQPKYEWVETTEKRKITDFADICKDCVMQLAKLL